MSKVSIVMPAYNAEQYITESIESGLGQTYADIEIIAVDDGSTDSTTAILKVFADKFPDKFRYFSQSNSGPAAARNKAIKEARGEYIAFLDSDDIWLPEKLKRQLDKLKKSPECAFIHTNIIRTDLEGKEQGTKECAIPEGWIFDALIKGNFICCSSVLAKKSCFEKVGLFNESRDIDKCEDYDMWLRIANQYRCCYVEVPLIKYRVNPTGHIRSDIKQAYQRRRRVFLNALKLYKGDKDKLKKEIDHKMMRSMGHSFFHVKEYKKASHAFLAALRCNAIDFNSLVFYLFSIARIITNKV